MPKSQETDELAALDLLLRGFQVSRMLRLVADLGVADRITPDGRVTVDNLAKDCGVRPQPLMRVLQALAAFGVFAVAADGSVAHTTRSRLLRTDRQNSLHPAARFWTAPGSWRAWERLEVALTDGVPHEAAWGVGRFEYLRAHPDEARIFDVMMANFPDSRHAAMAAAYDFSGARLIADIGGGNGAMLRQILARFSGPRGLVFDLEDVVRAIPPDGLMEGRIAVRAGSSRRGPRRRGRLSADPRPARLARRGLPAYPACLPRGDGTGDAAANRRALLDPDPARGRPAGYLDDCI